MVNDVASNNASLAAYSAAAGQRQPPQIRTESAPETQRPVAPTQESRAQNSGDRLTISQQAQQLSAENGSNDNENTESAQADQRRNDDAASQPARGASSSGAAQYRAVLQTVGAA